MPSYREIASYRDPIHGFIHADPLEQALINSRPLQRLRSIHQLGFAYLVFPGAEHSRFSHVLGAMELSGKVYDALAAKEPHLLDPDPRRPTLAACSGDCFSIQVFGRYSSPVPGSA